MTTEQGARLAARRLRVTRYEVVAVIGDARFFLGYTARPSRGAILDLARSCGERLIELSGLTDADPAPTYTMDGGLVFGERMVIRVGRTEREAILEGELPRP